MYADRFWWDFSDTIFGIYEIAELWKYFEKKNTRKNIKSLIFHLKLIFIDNLIFTPLSPHSSILMERYIAKNKVLLWVAPKDLLLQIITCIRPKWRTTLCHQTTFICSICRWYISSSLLVFHLLISSFLVFHFLGFLLFQDFSQFFSHLRNWVDATIHGRN